MSDKLLPVRHEQLRPQGGIDHCNPGQILKTAAAERRYPFVLCTLNEGRRNNVTELGREAYLVVMGPAVGFRNAGKAHRRHKVTHQLQVLSLVEGLRQEDIVVLNEELRG